MELWISKVGPRDLTGFFLPTDRPCRGRALQIRVLNGVAKLPLKRRRQAEPLNTAQPFPLWL